MERKQSISPFSLLLQLKSWAEREHHAIQLLWKTAQLLVTRVNLIYLVGEFFFLVLSVAEQNEEAG